MALSPRLAIRHQCFAEPCLALRDGEDAGVLGGSEIQFWPGGEGRCIGCGRRLGKDGGAGEDLRIDGCGGLLGDLLDAIVPGAFVIREGALGGAEAVEHGHVDGGIEGCGVVGAFGVKTARNREISFVRRWGGKSVFQCVSDGKWCLPDHSDMPTIHDSS